MIWKLVPHSGLESGSVRISFGLSRAEVRQLMPSHLRLKESSSFPNEQDYQSDDDSDWIRVRYNDNQVEDIELLQGALQFQELELFQTDLRRLKQQLLNRGLSLRPTRFGDGYDCVSLGINIASHEDVGGDDDGIEWVILSRRFLS